MRYRRDHHLGTSSDHHRVDNDPCLYRSTLPHLDLPLTNTHTEHITPQHPPCDAPPNTHPDPGPPSSTRRPSAHPSLLHLRRPFPPPYLWQDDHPLSFPHLDLALVLRIRVIHLPTPNRRLGPGYRRRQDGQGDEGQE